MPTLSYITPCYNSANHIGPLLESLEDQTCDDFEVIFVDDLSSDNTVALLNDWFSRTGTPGTVIALEENGGPGKARNHALACARGSFVTFIDSDDWIDPDTTARFVAILQEHDVDGILYDYQTEHDGVSTHHALAEGLAQGLVTISQALVSTSGGGWGKVYRKSVIDDNDLRFPDMKRAEDIAFTLMAIGSCEKGFYYLKKPLYHYLIREGSLVHDDSLYSHENAMKAFALVEERLKDRYPHELEAIFAVEVLYSTVMTLADKGASTRELLAHIERQEKRYPDWWENLDMNMMPRHQRLSLWAIKHRQLWIVRLLTAIRHKVVR